MIKPLSCVVYTIHFSSCCDVSVDCHWNRTICVVYVYLSVYLVLTVNWILLRNTLLFYLEQLTNSIIIMFVFDGSVAKYVDSVWIWLNSDVHCCMIFVVIADW